MIKGPYANTLLSRTVPCKMCLVLRVDEIGTDVFGDIWLLNCEPVRIELRLDAKPYSLATPRRVPFPILPKLEEELRCMQSLGIIEEVTKPLTGVHL